MILRQFLHNDPVGISYLFGCGGKAAGAVVDPVGDIQRYLQAAENAGMRINFVIDTHVHADHLSAGRALANSAGAAYVLSVEARVSFPHKACRTARSFRSETFRPRYCARRVIRPSTSAFL